MDPRPTVFIVDDDHSVRTSLEVLLRSVGLLVETYGTAQEFLDAFDPNRPGCLILDVRMAGMSGLELQRRLQERGLQIPVIIITGHGDVPVAVRAMKQGALELLEKPFSAQLLLEHVREGLERDARRREEQARRSDVEARLGSLTERERQVMEGIVAGKASKEVAAALGLSKKTVDVHRARVMQKLQVQTLAELVELVVTSRQALRQGAS